MAAERGRAARRRDGERDAGRDVPESQARFLAAVANGDERALRQLFVAFAPLLREQARSLGVRDEDREPLVFKVLETFALRLLDERRVPREIARYLVGALRNEARKLRRDERRRQGWYDRACDQHSGTTERVVAECHSAYGMRTSRGVEELSDAGDMDEDAVGRRPGDAATPIEQLGARAALAFSVEERQMMVGVSRGVPMRVIAEQLGIEYGTARVRVHRIRERLRSLLGGYVAELEGNEKREVERFFRRAGVDLAPKQALKEVP